MDNKTKTKKRILTGDRPTGKLHIGHFFGTLENRVKLQDEYETYILVADVQALTDNFECPEKVKENILETTIDNLAAGLDPAKCTFVVQSMIPEIAELTVLYSNLVTVARLERNPTIKTEIAQKKDLFGNKGESVTYGFLGYPVSQAADITAFNADLVPAGEDQAPLVELTKEVVRKFNTLYGETICVPEIKLSVNKRVKGLDGKDKMGKSLGNAIYLADDEAIVREKIRNAVTDPAKIKKDDPANPDICMVAYYHKMFSGEAYKKVCDECRKGARGCVDCKKELSDNTVAYLKPIKERRDYYASRPELVIQILKEGTLRAREVTKDTLKNVKKAMKIDYFEN